MGGGGVWLSFFSHFLWICFSFFDGFGLFLCWDAEEVIQGGRVKCIYGRERESRGEIENVFV